MLDSKNCHCHNDFYSLFRGCALSPMEASALGGNTLTPDGTSTQGWMQGETMPHMVS